MTLSLERKISLGFGAATALLLVVGAAALRSTAATVESAGWVAHTLQVRGDLEAAFADLIAAETGVRGYAIAGDTRYLAPYDSARATLGGLLSAVRTLTADNPTQQRRLDSLEALIPIRLGLLRDVVDARRTSGMAGAARAVISTEGRALTQRIRDLMQRMEAEEGRLLAQRSAALAATIRQVRVAVIGGTALGLALAIAASVLLGRELARRRIAEDSVRDSEHRLFQILEAMPVAVFALEAAGRPYFANRASQEILGKGIVPDATPDQLPEVYRAFVAGTNELYPPERQPIVRALRGERAHVADIEIERPDRRVPVEVWAAPVFDAAGRVAFGIAAFSDITERQRAQDAVAESEERFRALAMSANDAIVSADSHGSITYFNPGAERLFGYAASEVTGQPLTILMPEKFRDAHRAGLARYLATGEAHVVGKTVELAGRTKDGREFPLELSLASWKRGSEVAFTGILRDITERLRAAEALRASEERFRLLVGNVRDYAIYMLDPTGHVVSWNRGAEQIKGYAAEEIIGQHFSRFFTPEDVAAGRPATALQAAATAGRYEEENWRVRKDGSRFWADVVVTAVRDERGTLLGFAKVTRDLSERRRAEAEIRARSAQLEAANKELEAFSYSVSHDLRAPLRSIDGFSQALQEDYTARLDEEGRSHLRRVRAATQRMAHLIDDLLHLARVSRAELRSAPVDLSALAQSVVAELRQREPRRAVEFVCVDQARVRGDPALLRIVLENLLGNAWKFTAQRRPAQIEFGAAQEDGAPAYFVRDNGAGFDMTYADKLFGAFQRLHRTQDFEGTGIGLATVQRIIHRHGGRVWAESAVDQGATFYFTVQPPRT